MCLEGVREHMKNCSQDFQFLGQELNISELQSRSATHLITKFGFLIFYVLNLELMSY